jgi:thimet oligopeptidase
MSSGPAKLGIVIPEIATASSAAEVRAKCKEAIGIARAMVEELEKRDGPYTVENTLEPFDEAYRLVQEVYDQGKLALYVHPDPAVREAGDESQREATSFLNGLWLNSDVYWAFINLRMEGVDEETAFAISKIVREYRRSGVDRDERTRGRIKALSDEISADGAEFEKNVNEDVRSIFLDDPVKLEGLPADYVAAHPARDGRVEISTKYPDALPVFKYCRDPDVRRSLMKEFYDRGYPKNIEVLRRMLSRRRELARLLGYGNYAAYVTETKMARSDVEVQEFIDRVAQLTEGRTKGDLEELLALKREDDGGAMGVEAWDYNYYVEKLRTRRYGFDSKEVRPYLEFKRVRQGLFSIVESLFGVNIRKVEGAPVWHESVEAYDIYDRGELLGRFYLDLFPRDGKFTHAATFRVAYGLQGRRLPQIALECNFPDPAKSAGPTLMEHSDVVTFFHEFGHLLHGIFSGKAKWMKTSMDDVEWDFVEVPSKAMEEWATRPESLETFACHDSTGARAPRDLVERLQNAQKAARGILTSRQLFFAELSLLYHTREPEGLDTTKLAEETNRKYYPVPWFQGTHFQCSFGHLNDYSAIYYTYIWSDVIAKDLIEAFAKGGSVMDPSQAQRFRKEILEAGSRKPAAEMVKGFLGRTYGYEPFGKWLSES